MSEEHSQLITTLTRLADFLDRPTRPAQELTDIKGVAAMLNIAERTTRRLDVEGRLPVAIKIGKSKRWRISELHQWIEAGAPGRQKWEVIKERL
jgi:predicted DNA-binding transcriptional regulator AlpA